MTHLVQILLPLYDNEQRAFPPELYAKVRAGLTEKFGGLTAYTRAPAEGEWNDSKRSVRDEIVVYEIMVEDLDTEWWSEFRRGLEATFQQEEIIVRLLSMRQL